MGNIPNEINIEKLPGIQRGKFPALYYRDEIVWSTNKQYFAMAYTIFEASYGNSVGYILWGHYNGEKYEILGNPQNIVASCWRQPWCKWLDEKTFVFKAQKYDNSSTHMPLVIMHIEKGFAVLSDSNDVTKWLDCVSEYEGPYESYDEKSLIKVIINA